MERHTGEMDMKTHRIGKQVLAAIIIIIVGGLASDATK
jgi:hypothetical protein